VSVQLSRAEQAAAGRPGFERCCSSVVRGDNNKHGMDPKVTDIWSTDIHASQAEYAVARELKLPWTGLVERSPVDVGDNIQVRHSPWDGASLIVRKGDDSGHIYVLVTGGREGRFTIHGYMRGFEAKVDEFWSGPGLAGRPPAWFVPQSELLPLANLKNPPPEASCLAGDLRAI